jgi:hypothetical protein
MPENDIEVDATNLVVEWGALRLAGPGALRLTSDAMELQALTGGSAHVPYEELAGGAWRTGSLTIHGGPGRVIVESSRGLEFVWVQLLERACPLPELARSHRLLGSRRGGSVQAQGRFLAPLIQARRRIEIESDLEARVAAIEARALRERIAASLQAIARDTYPASHPDQRGLEAELEEALSPLFAGLDAMESAAARFRSAPEAIRFIAWREWVSTVSNAFALADSGWASAARLLP